MTKNDKILLVCCFILGCIITVFVAGCSKPKVDNETKVSYPYMDTLSISVKNAKEVTEEKLIAYTVQTEEDTPPITFVSCKGCHFVCKSCTE